METGRAIDVFLADDNLIVREGVRALIERNADLRVVGVAADYDGVVDGCAKFEPQVLVTDVRMPPSFRREGIDAAREVRSLLPGTGVVVLSQYDTRSTRSRCSRPGRPATGTCSRTGSRRARSWPTRSGRWRPAAPRLTPPSSRPWCARWSRPAG